MSYYNQKGQMQHQPKDNEFSEVIRFLQEQSLRINSDSKNLRQASQTLRGLSKATISLSENTRTDSSLLRKMAKGLKSN